MTYDRHNGYQIDDNSSVGVMNAQRRSRENRSAANRGKVSPAPRVSAVPLRISLPLRP
jgi:hypothetical protein